MPDDDNDENGWVRRASRTGSLAVDPAIGNIRALVFKADGREIAPLDTAPWVDEPEIQADETIAPVDRKLAGDFLCAPFGVNDRDDVPIHGWPANSGWRVQESSGRELLATLERRVMGADIEKRLVLADEAPILYQTNRISGGEGGLTVAHHPMVKLRGGGRFCTSRKAVAITPADVSPDLLSALAPGQEASDLTAMRGVDGNTVDLTKLPIGELTHDFVTLVEMPGSQLGWSAILRDAEDDIVFFLKDPGVLPVTMLWHSNGARDFAPWFGRHTGVIGVEDGCTSGSEGHAKALSDNEVSRHGVASALVLGPDITHSIRHVIGACPRPEGWKLVSDIVVQGDGLHLVSDRGERISMPFDTGFFAPGS